MRLVARVLVWTCVGLLVPATGCKTKPQQGQPPTEALDQGHHLPGIDCPLRRAGVDPGQLRPFAEVEKYIAFLDRPERDAWQKPEDVVRALGLRDGETVYDLGAGSGYFSFRFARALPRGKVVAGDLEPEMIRHIHHKAMAEGLTNLNPVIIKADEPQVPREADVVFVCDVLHHVKERAPWLKKVAGEMKPGARFVLVEFKEGKLPEGPPESAKIPRKQLVELVTQAGLQFESEKPGLLPYQVLLVFRKRAGVTGVVEPTRGAADVTAYYFHGTVRCETCLKIEEHAREVVSKRFGAESAAKRLAFRSVNYDEPGNAHFLTDYKLPCPSLVLVRQDADWKVLGQAWELVQIPPKLDQYIEEETARFLEGKVSHLPEGGGATNTSSSVSSERVVGRAVGDLAELYNLAGEMNAVLVFVPVKGQGPTASALAAIQGAKERLETRFAIKIGLFTLAPDSRDSAELAAHTTGPGVVAIVKTGAKKCVSGELTEQKIVEGFMAAVAAGGCCPLGYPGEE